MKLLELHILQSFPVSCLNRDDAGLPKTAVFGGVNRARLSSQCLKRAVREEAQRINAGLFRGKRTKWIARELRAAIKENQSDTSLPNDKIDLLVRGALGAFGKADGEQIKALYFLAPQETKSVAEALVLLIEQHEKEWEAWTKAVEARTTLGESPKADDKKKADNKVKAAEKKLSAYAEKAADKALKELRKSGSHLKDSVDIALFGRMAADSPELNIDGAASFSHALSTHEAEIQQDFYSAVDDVLHEKLAAREEGAHSGSGMLGVLEFTSATYYRYIALDLDSLFDPENGTLRDMEPAEREDALEAFIEAALKAIPRARKTGMNAHTLPSYAMGIVREQGAPVQLVNAFERPVKPAGDGFVSRSATELVKHHQELSEVWGLNEDPQTTVSTGTTKPATDGAPEQIPFPEFTKTLVKSIQDILAS